MWGHADMDSVAGSVLANVRAHPPWLLPMPVMFSGHVIEARYFLQSSFGQFVNETDKVTHCR